MNKKLPDYYKILGVERNADTREIERAFKQMAMKCHPDRFSDPQEKIQKTREFQQLNDAYMLLSKYVKRKDYDIALEQQENQERAARAEEERMAREAQERREREEQERRERNARKKADADQTKANILEGFSFGSFWFQILKLGPISAQEVEEMATLRSLEKVERIDRYLRMYSQDGVFLNASSPNGKGTSMLVRATAQHNSTISADFLFIKKGAHYYTWQGTFQYGSNSGSGRGTGCDFKEIIGNSYNGFMAWCRSIIHRKTDDAQQKQSEPEYAEDPAEVTKPQRTAQAPVDGDPDSEGWQVWALIGLVILFMFVIFIQVY